MNFKFETIHTSSFEQEKIKMRVILLQIHCFKSGKVYVISNISALPLDFFVLHCVHLGNANKSHLQHYSHLDSCSMALHLFWSECTSVPLPLVNIFIWGKLFTRLVLCRGRSVCHNRFALTPFSMKRLILTMELPVLWLSWSSFIASLPKEGDVFCKLTAYVFFFLRNIFNRSKFLFLHVIHLSTLTLHTMDYVPQSLP